MRKLLNVIAVFALLSVWACKDENTWEKYEKWRKENEAFFAQKEAEVDANGNKVYEVIRPVWNTNAYILRKMYKRGKGSQAPYSTSTVKTKYIGMLKNGDVFGSSYTQTDSISQFRVDEVVDGWQVALQYMVPGDSCEVIIPWQLGYGENGKYTANNNYNYYNYYGGYNGYYGYSGYNSYYNYYGYGNYYYYNYDEIIKPYSALVFGMEMTEISGLDKEAN